MYDEVTKTLQVPKNTGADGFVLALKGIIRLPRVQRVEILATGKVTYSYLKPHGASDQPLNIEFETVVPSHVVRNVEMVEVALVEEETAPTVMCRLFRSVRLAGMLPTVLVSGADSAFWEWHKKSGVDLEDAKDSAYGLPVVLDRHIPDEVIVLCAAYDKNSTIIDTVRVFKAVMLT